MVEGMARLARCLPQIRKIRPFERSGMAESPSILGDFVNVMDSDMNGLSNQRVVFCSRPGKRDELNVRGLVVDRQRESRVGRLLLAWMTWARMRLCLSSFS